MIVRGFPDCHSLRFSPPWYSWLCPPLIMAHLLSPAVFAFHLCFPSFGSPLLLACLGNFFGVVRSFEALVKCGGFFVVMPLQTQMQALDPMCWQSLTSSSALFLSLLDSCSRAWLPVYFVSLVFLVTVVPFAVAPHRCNTPAYSPEFFYFSNRSSSLTFASDWLQMSWECFQQWDNSLSVSVPLRIWLLPCLSSVIQLL